jgi:hypothetical protein
MRYVIDEQPKRDAGAPPPRPAARSRTCCLHRHCALAMHCTQALADRPLLGGLGDGEASGGAHGAQESSGHAYKSS